MTLPGAPSPANVRLYSDKTSALPTRVLLDANVVLDLYEHHLATNVAANGRRQGGPRRHADLAEFLDRLNRGASLVIVTPIVLEEVFHVLLTRVLKPVLERFRCDGEKELRKDHPKEHLEVRRQTTAM